MDWTTAFDEAVRQTLPELKIVDEEPLSRHTTLRIGGPARRMAFPTMREQLEPLLHIAAETGARPLVIGRGSNLLAADEGVDRLVVNTTDMAAMELIDGTTLRADCGVSLRRLAELAASHSLTGLEFAHGIPGTLGGGVCMNAGAYGGEMKQVLQSAEVLFPGEGVRVLSNGELQLGYRHSLLTERPEAVVLSATVTLARGDGAAIRETMNELAARRKASQPLEWPSAGSTFKRPEGHFAGTLIDRCGLKGLTVGGAQVSEKHAGFLINRGSATFADMTALIAEVRRRVLEETGVRLETEVKIVR